ncbi:hypothetical protein AMK16_01145 [Streptomyces sp. CB00455]|uniref:hypothetical protein n=1 Tax=Streptomyces sp. CB00455 TaxID=1703927 RepID=UPI0009396CC6|nr:hypothetical protein [Streptomyces sp. CB00455]OKK21894.1 hypothetical protein AMK16_01145 [Streptomyces sp. CB00455]
MGWASWTTVNVFAARSGVRTEEAGVITGELSVHTTWTDGEARFAVQYNGSSDWFTLVGSPVPCATETDSRTLHEAVVTAVRTGRASDMPSAMTP